MPMISFGLTFDPIFTQVPADLGGAAITFLETEVIDVSALSAKAETDAKRVCMLHLILHHHKWCGHALMCGF